MLRRLIFGSPNANKDSIRIVWQATKSAFDIFRDENFRLDLKFNSLSQEEQDRIFNELVVTGLCLVYLQTETLIRFHEEGIKECLKKVKENLPIAYVEILRSFGIEAKFLNTWEQLIDLRLNEYRNDYNEHRSELPDVEEHNPWILVAAIGAFDHITRGSGQPENPAYKKIVRWLFKLSDDTNKTFIKAVKRI